MMERRKSEAGCTLECAMQERLTWHRLSRLPAQARSGPRDICKAAKLVGSQYRSVGNAAPVSIDEHIVWFDAFQRSHGCRHGLSSETIRLLPNRINSITHLHSASKNIYFVDSFVIDH